MTPTQELANDIAAQLLAALVDPLRALLGYDEAIDHIAARIDARAPMWASTLLHGDEREAAGVVADLACALQLDDPPPTWWRTPLGRAVARSVGHPTAEAVSFSVAAAMLGGSKSLAQKLVDQGKLDRHPDGGITATSVRMRLAR